MLRKGTRAASCHPILWAALILISLGLGLGKKCWGPTVGCCGCCWLGVGLPFPQFPPCLKLWQEWTIPHSYGPSLASKALKRVGSLLLAVPSCLLAVLPLISTYGSPCPGASRCPVVWGRLSKTSPAIMRAGAARSTPVCPSPSMGLSLGCLGHGLGCCPALSGQEAISWQSVAPILWCPPRISDSINSSYFVPDLLVSTFTFRVAP